VPVARTIGFMPIPPVLLLIVVVVTAAYVVAAECAKR
jgi:hypothetical protein